MCRLIDAQANDFLSIYYGFLFFFFISTPGHHHGNSKQYLHPWCLRQPSLQKVVSIIHDRSHRRGDAGLVNDDSHASSNNRSGGAAATRGVPGRTLALRDRHSSDDLHRLGGRWPQQPFSPVQLAFWTADLVSGHFSSYPLSTTLFSFRRGSFEASLKSLPTWQPGENASKCLLSVVIKRCPQPFWPLRLQS